MNRRQHYFEANIRRPIILRKEPFWTPVRVAFALTYLIALVTLGAVL